MKIIFQEMIVHRDGHEKRCRCTWCTICLSWIHFKFNADVDWDFWAIFSMRSVFK